MPRKKAPVVGIYRRGQKWRAIVHVNGQAYTKSFPLSTPTALIRGWREETRAGAIRNTGLAAPDAKHLPRSLTGWCYVYFAQAGATVKIGRSTDPSQRIRELQTMHHVQIVLLACVGAHAALESELHRRFEHLRTRDNGEWFRLEQDLLAFIWALQRGANPVELLFEDPRVVLGWYLGRNLHPTQPASTTEAPVGGVVCPAN